MSIKIDLKIFLFLLLFCITSQIEIYIVLMVFAIIHELGHLAAGLILGFRPQEIKITPIGLQIKFKTKCEEYNQKILKGNTLGIKKVIIAAAGPLTNFIIIVIMTALINIRPEILQINFYNINYPTIIYSNILIGIFNLIPIYPLDGGRILNEILHIKVGLQKSYTYTHIISKTTIILLTVISSIAILYLQNISIVIILAYLWCLVLKQNKIYYSKQKIYKIQKGENFKINKKLAN